MSLIAFEKHFFVVDEKVACAFANGHTSSNIPDPIRTRKSSDERPGQYWGGGPPGKPFGCCELFLLLNPRSLRALWCIAFFQKARTQKWRIARWAKVSDKSLKEVAHTQSLQLGIVLFRWFFIAKQSQQEARDAGHNATTCKQSSLCVRIT